MCLGSRFVFHSESFYFCELLETVVHTKRAFLLSAPDWIHARYDNRVRSHDERKRSRFVV